MFKQASKISPALALVFGRVLLLSVGCGSDGADPYGTEAESFVEGTPEAGPPVAVFFDGVPDPDQRAWNAAANQWIVAEPKSIAFYFRVETVPMPSDACGLVVRAGEENGLRLGPCLSVATFAGEPDPCDMKEALAAMLGVEADLSSCDVTEGERAQVVEKWGKPWAITIVP